MDWLDNMGLMIGALLTLFGFLALLLPNLARFINFPGNARMKAIGTMAIGIIFIATSLIFEGW